MKVAVVLLFFIATVSAGGNYRVYEGYKVDQLESVTKASRT